MSIKNKIFPCPICSRDISLLFLSDVRVFYNECPRCKINIFEIDDDVAWVKNHSEKAHWFFRFSRRYWGTGLPKMPFELHLLIKEPDTVRVTKLSDLIFTLYKKMYMGYQVPFDIAEYLDENKI